jgi:glycerol dehydrogenase-like iron-containing ADH family enzyme
VYQSLPLSTHADVGIHAGRRLGARRSARVHAPNRYVQGPGVLNDVGRYLSITRIRRGAILMSARVARHEGLRSEAGLRASGISSVDCRFDGETSLIEIKRHGAL